MSRGGCTLVWLLLAALSFVLVLAVTTALKLRANRVLQVACLPSAPEAEPAPVGAEFVENLALTGLSDTELAARRIAKTPLGELGLQMGCIFAADLLVDPERQAFSRVVSPDSYLSTLHRARDLVAVAEWRLAEGQPRRWALALLPGQALRTLKADEVFGYPVDAVFGPFMNVAGQAAFLTRDQRGQRRLTYSDTCSDVLKETPDQANGTAFIYEPLDDNTGTVAIFKSGWGNGIYPSFWGLDALGRPILLVTNFGVLEQGYEREETTEPPEPPNPP